MNGTNLFRLIVTVLVTLWATTELMPPTSTPFEEYIINQVTAEKGPDGQEIKTLDENLADFTALVDRANQKVAGVFRNGL